jgi:quercetin dioxygenase-like cupin family protein
MRAAFRRSLRHARSSSTGPVAWRRFHFRRRQTCRAIGIGHHYLAINAGEDMGISHLKRTLVVGLTLLGGGATVYAATSVINAIGTIENYEPFDGPATMTARNLLIDANEVLPWHVHAGIGAYTIVKAGTLTVEDGCGDSIVYPAGSAFIEPAGRVHRGKAGPEPVETVQTFLVPQGTGISINVSKACGRPLKVEECKGNGWSNFDYPRTFSSQGECIDFVKNAS